ISGTATIPAGQTSVPVTVHPLADSLAEGDETIMLNLTPNASYETGIPDSADITIADRPEDAWRFSRFGSSANDPAISGDLADPDHDGSRNLIEYLTGSDPLAEDNSPPVLGSEPSFLTLTYRRAVSAVDVSVEVEESLNLSDWTNAQATEQILSD